MHHDKERGANLIEYMFLVALIAVACIAAATFLGQSRDAVFEKSGSSIAKAQP